MLSGDKNRTDICDDYKRPPSHLGTHIKSEGIKTGMLCKCKSKESWSSILVTDKTDFQIKTVARTKEGTVCWLRDQPKKMMQPL